MNEEQKMKNKNTLNVPFRRRYRLSQRYAMNKLGIFCEDT